MKVYNTRPLKQTQQILYASSSVTYATTLKPAGMCGQQCQTLVLGQAYIFREFPATDCEANQCPYKPHLHTDPVASPHTELHLELTDWAQNNSRAWLKHCEMLQLALFTLGPGKATSINFSIETQKSWLKSHKAPLIQPVLYYFF